MAIADDAPKGTVVTVSLKSPVMHGEQEVAQLHFQPLKWGHLRKIPLQEPTYAVIIDVAAALCGMPSSVLAQLEAEDAAAVHAFVEGALGPFLGPGLS